MNNFLAGFQFVAGIAGGFMAIRYGQRVLKGTAGQLQILGVIEKFTPELPADRPGYKPCVSCEKGIEEGLSICSHCGWRQPYGTLSANPTI